jgi:hypothetical protein
MALQLDEKKKWGMNEKATPFFSKNYFTDPFFHHLSW